MAITSRLARTLEGLGDFGLFVGRTLAWLPRGPSRGTLVPTLYWVGVRSVLVVSATGLFIGMILAVQSYPQLKQAGFATSLGGAINLSVVRELGPVLAGAMLAGRLGSAMAAELATMRVTEQVDALATLGAHPYHYLVMPRLLACLVMVPLLTILADFMGILGGAAVSLYVFHIEPYHYWEHAQGFPGNWDLLAGLVKPLAFGAAIALIACYRGLNSGAGAEGVGRAATEAFVASLLTILVLDFFLGLFLNRLYELIWPAGQPSLF